MRLIVRTWACAHMSLFCVTMTLLRADAQTKKKTTVVGAKIRTSGTLLSTTHCKYRRYMHTCIHTPLSSCATQQREKRAIYVNAFYRALPPRSEHHKTCATCLTWHKQNAAITHYSTYKTNLKLPICSCYNHHREATAHTTFIAGDSKAPAFAVDS